MPDVYIWLIVWVVIIIMLIIGLTKIESRMAEDRINNIFEYLEKRKRGGVDMDIRYRNAYIMNFVEQMENTYILLSPEKAYLANKDIIASAYSHLLFDMDEVRKLLKMNSDMLRSKGIDPWEVLRND